MIVTEPTDIPVTIPEASTVAIAVLLLLHTPPAVAFDKVIVEPAQTLLFPVIEATIGNGSMVITEATVVIQLLLFVTVYVIETEPADIPVTIPDASTVAIAVLLLLHTPPAVAFDKFVVDPAHNTVFPVIGATVGNEFTIIEVEAIVTQLLLFVTV